MGVRLLLLIALLVGGCGLFMQPVHRPPSEQVKRRLLSGELEEGFLVRRYADGRLLVRRADQSTWELTPKRHCSWCWMYVGGRVYLKFDETSSLLLSAEGEVAECWTGVPVRSY